MSSAAWEAFPTPAQTPGAPGSTSIASPGPRRGAVSAFAPTGLSLNDPTHQYHRAFLAEWASGRHERVGDAILAAQSAYAASGSFPELLSIYHLLGDPALRIR